MTSQISGPAVTRTLNLIRQNFVAESHVRKPSLLLKLHIVVRNAEFVLALLLLFLFLCTEKYPELKISNLCLLCFVCLFMKNCRDFGQRTLAPIPWGLFMFIARYCLTPRVLLLFLFRPREEWEKLIWNPLRLRRQQHFTAAQAMNQ